MRFNTVEVERAYIDYLDSLDDWPPPQGVSAESTTGMTQTTEDDRPRSVSTPTSTSLHS